MKNKIAKIITVSAVVTVGGIIGHAMAIDEHSHFNHEDHSNSKAYEAVVPVEQGQSAFAAIAEIVSIIENDHETDWSKINVSALREHLVDMNSLTLNTDILIVKKEKSIVFEATGSGKAQRSLQNMVPAHAQELNKLDGWSVFGKPTQTGAILTITAENISDLVKIEALGFYGLMAKGAHHQAHHLAIARGIMVH